jgi:hypothetical protein
MTLRISQNRRPDTGFSTEITSRKFEDDRGLDFAKEDIHQMVTKVAWEFIQAATHFQVALARKMDLGEYVYGQRRYQGGEKKPDTREVEMPAFLREPPTE